MGLTYRIWNKTDSINGVQAEHFLESSTFKGYNGDIILFLQDNVVTQVERKDTLSQLYNIDITLGLDAFVSEYLNKKQTEPIIDENIEIGAGE